VRYYLLALLGLFLFTFEALRGARFHTVALLGLLTVALAGRGWITERLRPPGA